LPESGIPAITRVIAGIFSMFAACRLQTCLHDIDASSKLAGNTLMHAMHAFPNELHARLQHADCSLHVAGVHAAHFLHACRLLAASINFTACTNVVHARLQPACCK